jgi:hypothetical protein
MVHPSTDPLVVDIARRLLVDGRFEMPLETGEFQTGRLQAIVDVGWAARKAGQMLGHPVQVSTSRSEEPGAPLVVTAVLVDN